MAPWTFYPAFLGTVISIVGWTYLGWRKHDASMPRNLSQIGAEHSRTLLYYRTVLWVCGPMFAITVYLIILPRIDAKLLLALCFSGVVIPEMLVGVFPARGRSLNVHNTFAILMGLCMGLLTLLFSYALDGVYHHILSAIVAIMFAIAAMILFDPRRHLYYELLYLFLSHISILVAAIAFL
jgi:hypothetical protein